MNVLLAGADDVSGLPAHRIEPLSDREFRAFRAIIENGLGIQVTEQKRELIAARLARRLRILRLDGFSQYLEYVTLHPEEMQELFNRISTNETSFFREPGQFEYLERTIAPMLERSAEAGRRARTLAVWSAGCSTGEEAYSIAMVCLAALPGWKVEILATDISTRALAHAQRGVWPVEVAETVPVRFRKRFLLRGVRSQAGQMRVSLELRSAVRFDRLNLNTETPAEPARFDLIFCRNVLIYFAAQSRREAVERLFARLEPEGFIFLGHSESLIGYFDRFRSAAPSIYRLRLDRRG